LPICDLREEKRRWRFP